MKKLLYILTILVFIGCKKEETIDIEYNVIASESYTLEYYIGYTRYREYLKESTSINFKTNEGTKIYAIAEDCKECIIELYIDGELADTDHAIYPNRTYCAVRR